MRERWGIPGWFNFSGFYDEVAEMLPSPCHIVEVGVLFGCSASYLAKRLRDRGTSFHFDLVDPFDESKLGSESKSTVELHKGFRNAFDHYAKAAALDGDNINVIPTIGLNAAWRYPFQSLDFVFLDGDHTEANVHMEIEAFRPRMKMGAILAGHDIQDEGVMRAVTKSFGTAWETKPGNVWMKRVLR